jgi:hypothetical protein
MGRKACTEPQCLYKGALFLLPEHILKTVLYMQRKTNFPSYRPRQYLLRLKLIRYFYSFSTSRLTKIIYDKICFSFNKSKRIPSIFDDESTGSFICLTRHIYMSHVNKVQLVRVKMIRVAVIRRASLREAWFFIESLLSPV